MFPISDSAKAKGFPILNLIIIGINVFIFWQMFFVGSFEGFIQQYALTPEKIDFSNFSTLWPLVTSTFLHGGFLHIISNMWFLWVFGDNIEGEFGKIAYLIIYFASGIAGNLVQYSLDTTSAIPIIGASGAVSGILGAYFIAHPHSKVKSIVPIFLFLTIVNVPASIYIIYWFILQLISGFSTIGSQSGGVAFWAHVGGFVAGVILAKLFQIGDSEHKGYIEGELVD